MQTCFLTKNGYNKFMWIRGFVEAHFKSAIIMVKKIYLKKKIN